MTKNQKTPLLLAAPAAALLIANGTAAYWFLAQKQKEVLDTMPVGVEVVPQDALMSISMTTNQEQWQKLRQFGTPETQAAFDARLVELRDRLLIANGYDYSKDIQPWVGSEVTVAFLSSAGPSPSSSTLTQSEKPLVMVMPVANPLLAKQLLAKQLLDQQESQETWVERSYKGIKIKETQKTADELYSTAVLSTRYLVVTVRFVLA